MVEPPGQHIGRGIITRYTIAQFADGCVSAAGNPRFPTEHSAEPAAPQFFTCGVAELLAAVNRVVNEYVAGSVEAVSSLVIGVRCDSGGSTIWPEGEMNPPTSSLEAYAREVQELRRRAAARTRQPVPFPEGSPHDLLPSTHHGKHRPPGMRREGLAVIAVAVALALGAASLWWLWRKIHEAVHLTLRHVVSSRLRTVGVNL